MEIRWSPEALADLEAITAHIREENPAAARRVALALLAGVGRLKDFPESGRIGRLEGTRELVYPSLPYLAVYELRDAAVEILTVLHGAQRWP